jgi:Domain of unknown function (DUF5615)
MFRLIIDQNFDHRIVRGLRLRMPELDVMLARDVGLARAADPDLLEWAGSAGRILVTHDAKTMPIFAYERVATESRMQGLIVVRTSVPIGVAINELVMIFSCCRENELEGQVYDVPI